MVNIIENWSEIKGEVLSVKDDDNKDFKIVTLKLKGAGDHKNYPNLIKSKLSEEIPVKIKKDEVTKLDLKEGKDISGIARTAGNNLHFFKQGTVKAL